MNFGDFKKSITANLLSFMGYAYLLVWSYIYLIVRPDIMAWNAGKETDRELVNMAHASVFVDVIFSCFILCLIISSILIIVNIIEISLRKKNIIPDLKIYENIFYLCFFWLGILLQISPIFMLSICFFS